jgi:hypothetical protein
LNTSSTMSSSCRSRRELEPFRFFCDPSMVFTMPVTGLIEAPWLHRTTRIEDQV